VYELDGWSLEPLDSRDGMLIAELLVQRGHRYLLDFPPDPDLIGGAVDLLAKEPWTLLLGTIRDDVCAGVATTFATNVKNGCANLVALFVDPANAALPLALYMRHLFWSFPINRLYAHIPDMDMTREYIDLYQAAGFVDEGRLVKHAVIGGHEFDVVTLGLLRSDLAEWCRANEPRLALDDG
jgi:hypothetical protein